jgi:hypothetical protein
MWFDWGFGSYVTCAVILVCLAVAWSKFRKYSAHNNSSRW